MIVFKLEGVKVSLTACDLNFKSYFSSKITKVLF